MISCPFVDKAGTFCHEIAPWKIHAPICSSWPSARNRGDRIGSRRAWRHPNRGRGIQFKAAQGLPSAGSAGGRRAQNSIPPEMFGIVNVQNWTALVRPHPEGGGADAPSRLSIFAAIV